MKRAELYERVAKLEVRVNHLTDEVKELNKEIRTHRAEVNVRLDSLHNKFDEHIANLAQKTLSKKTLASIVALVTSIVVAVAKILG